FDFYSQVYFLLNILIFTAPWVEPVEAQRTKQPGFDRLSPRFYVKKVGIFSYGLRHKEKINQS
ncbi:MAG: hypothetical protein OXC48_11475, partial [Endozoicomonadaceae bacterium]|nr:hypothetical protein [Endozoicomonadaceae bacterium]